MGKLESLPLTQLSNSSLDKFEACPLSFYHRYLNPSRPKPEGITEYYAQYGSLIHFFAEYYPRTNFCRHLPYDENQKKDDESGDLLSHLASYGKQLMQRSTGLTLDEMFSLYNELFQLIQFPNDEIKEEYYQQGIEFLNTLTEMDWSHVIGLEQHFEIKLFDDVPPLIGYIDKVERDEKGIVVTDYKTSKPYSENTLIRKSQLQKYGMACYFLYGELPYKYRYHFTRFNKIVEVSVPIEELTRVKNLIRFQYLKISHFQRTGQFPAQYNEFYCNNFCGFKHLCPTYKTYNP